jgi:hypothetical protein
LSILKRLNGSGGKSAPAGITTEAGGRYSRLMSYNERLFLALDEICPPCCCQHIFDGEGTLDYSRWHNAVEVASAVNPGSRVALRGYVGFSHWVDTGITPRVREVDGSRWDGTGPEGAPFLLDRLSYREGSVAEVVLVHGPVPRVVFRGHHGAMDGRGVLLWAEDIFRVLKGEKALGAFSTVNDYELVRSFQKLQHNPFPSHYLAPTGKPDGQGSGILWKRMQLRGKFQSVLARCIKLAALEAWRHAEGPVMFGIPVDMRPRLGSQRSNANLSFAIYVEVKPDTSIKQINEDIQSQIHQGREGMTFRGDRVIRHVPLRLITSRARKIIKMRNARCLYSLSGIISNLGRIDLSIFQGGGFKSNAFWSIPPRNEYHPSFMGVIGHGDALELILSMPRVLGDNQRLEEALHNIARGIQEKGGF